MKIEPAIHGTLSPSLPERPLGLTVLHEPKVGVKIVNIVFVHGLGGSARETWTHHSPNVFWPSLLHEDNRFCNARISSFGYDANFKNIFAAKNVLDISDFSKQLLDSLDLHYDTYNEASVHTDFRLTLGPHDLCGA